MISGDDGDAIRLADFVKPQAGGRELRREAEIDQVAGHGDMVRRRRPYIVCQRGQDRGAERMPAVAPPVEITEGALGGEVAEPDLGQRPEMGIGNMGQAEHGADLADGRGRVKALAIESESE